MYKYIPTVLKMLQKHGKDGYLVKEDNPTLAAYEYLEEKGKVKSEPAEPINGKKTKLYKVVNDG